MWRAVAIVLVSLLPAVALADTSSALVIDGNGHVSAKTLTVMQTSENGATYFVRALWGNAFVRLTVLGAPNGVSAKVTKNNGGVGALTDVKAGDIINIEGTLTPAADTLLVNATAIKDLSLNIEAKTVSGTIKTLDKERNTFTIVDKKLGLITVVPPVQIIKGERTISVQDLTVGDKVLSVSGNYDFNAKVLSASSMAVYQNPNVFALKNFEGTLNSLSATSLPATATLTVGNTSYTVYLSATTTVLNAAKAPVNLQRFAAGDKVRVFGAIRRTNFGEIDAQAIRDLNF